MAEKAKDYIRSEDMTKNKIKYFDTHAKYISELCHHAICNNAAICNKTSLLQIAEHVTTQFVITPQFVINFSNLDCPKTYSLFLCGLFYEAICFMS